MAYPLWMVISGGLFALSQIRGALDVYPSLGIGYQKDAFNSYPNQIPMLTELVDMYYKGLITKDDYIQTSRENGFDNNYAEIYLDAGLMYLSAMDYVNLYRRGKIEKTDLENQLEKLHINKKTTHDLINATEFYPTPQDLIRFAVREVFTPQIAQQYGLFEDLPQEFLTESKKVGLEESNAKRYWAAHWELPSVSMGFEMFHRRIIDENELYQLLRALDVMPYWRDKLTQISFNPLTRVDVRRMHKIGVLSDEEVYNAYLDIGYSPENAKRMQDFTIMYNVDEENTVTKSNMDKAYKKSLITLETYKSFLKEAGYGEQAINFYADMVDYEKDENALDDYVKELTSLYKLGSITIEQVQDSLNSYDLPASFITATVNKIKLTRSQKVKLPSKDDLIRFLKANLISDVEFIERMLKLGYNQIDTELYLSEIAITQDVEDIKYLSVTQYKKWYTAGLLTEQRLLIVLKAKKVSNMDINTILRELKQPKTS